MNMVISQVLEALRAGLLAKAYEFQQALNDIAIYLYNKAELNDEDLEDMKGLLAICNITYNNTDREILPIEDGVYDLLLEKYRKYNPHFQVGAEVISFLASENPEEPYIDKQMKQAIYFVGDPDYKEEENRFLKNIIVDPTKFIDSRDFERTNIPQDPEFISKRYKNTAHEHPELVGTLDKVKYVLLRDAAERGVENDSNVKILERDFFLDHLNRHIITPKQKFRMILELKYDGISVEADCTDVVKSARSRGDTGTDQAADLTPFLKGYRFPHRAPGSPSIGVKFEAIITQTDLPYFNAVKGYEYKNCRSAIVGLLSSSDAWKYRDFITLVPLAVEQEVFETVCEGDRLKEIEFLNTYFVSKGCPLRYAKIKGDYLENLVWINIFVNNAEMARPYVPFMYDGVVVSYRDKEIRQALGRENFINKYSIAVKFNPLKKETVFRGYSYTVGQDGSITPMIHYDPVEFYGTIHSKSSGHSYARFQELDLRINDIISVEYVNDVMPYVSKPINDWNLENATNYQPEPFPVSCPVCGRPVTISETGKSAYCTNPDCGGRQLARMVNTCAKLNLDGFGEATIEQLGCYHLKDLVELVCLSGWQDRLKEKGFGPVESSNINQQLVLLMTTPMDEARLLGSIGFTSISVKTWELILGDISFDEIHDFLTRIDPSGIYAKQMKQRLASVKGIGPTTADTIVREFQYFRSDIEYMMMNAMITKYVRKFGKNIIFSGFRDAELAQRLTDMGFIVHETTMPTVDTYALLVPNMSFTSNKVRRAQNLGVMIVPVNEFVENIDKYI